MEIINNCSLLPYNTFGIAAVARILISYDCEEELLEAIRIYKSKYSYLPLLHIGCGSNLLFLKDFEGVVLVSKIKGVEVIRDGEDDVFVKVGAGEICDEFIDYSLNQGWYGMENLSYIPGQIGSSAIQNIGAYGVEASDVIHSVEGISIETGEKKIWENVDCQYAYRWSIFKGELRGKYIISGVVFHLHHKFVPKLSYKGILSALEAKGYSADVVDAKLIRSIIIEIRKEKLPDPKVQGNAGSFFMNPVVDIAKFHEIVSSYPNVPYYEVDEQHVKVPAGWLIEQCGWKGKSLGRAAVHARQALVLVNLGGAKGEEILTLCNEVRASVLEKFGINLTPEVNFI